MCSVALEKMLAGTVAKGEGSLSCSLCEVATFQNASQMQICIPCGANRTGKWETDILNSHMLKNHDVWNVLEHVMFLYP